MSDLVAFIEARLAEDEAVARAATAGSWSVFDMDKAEKMKGEPVNEPGKGWYWVWADEKRPWYAGVLELERHHPDCNAAIGSANITDEGGKQTLADAEHIARHNPARVLAGVAAKRRVLELHRAEVGGGVDDCGFNCRGGRCQTLRALASEWAGAEGWDEGWAL